MMLPRGSKDFIHFYNSRCRKQPYIFVHLVCCQCAGQCCTYSLIYSLTLAEVCLCGNVDTRTAEEERSQQVWSQGVS